MLHLMARLPLRVLYGLSDLGAAVLWHAVRYRRSTVLKNLTESFPEKTPAEVRQVAKSFYRNFADYTVETLKLLHISDSEIERRFEFEGIDIIDSLLGQGRSIVAYFSHCGNWEWATSVTLHSRLYGDPKVAYCQVYRPLKDKWFDSLMLKLRSRFGSESLPKATVLRHLLDYRRRGIATITGFMSDQKPSGGDNTHVLMFLNHPTAMITGTETLARRMDMAVVYWDMYKPRRGHYKIKVRLMAEHAGDTKPGELTDAYARALERTIRRNPPLWLWSHKRWKHPVTLPKND